MRKDLLELTDTYRQAGDAILAAIAKDVDEAGGFVNASNNKQEKPDIRQRERLFGNVPHPGAPAQRKRCRGSVHRHFRHRLYGQLSPGQVVGRTLDVPQGFQRPVLPDHSLHRPQHRRISSGEGRLIGIGQGKGDAEDEVYVGHRSAEVPVFPVLVRGFVIP